ncbi:MAG TPA: DUF86 domain-containing protein [Candidatus Kapabacteria bacterium]
MSKRDVMALIYDMHLHASDVCVFTSDKGRADLDTDRMLMLAVTRALEVIGEAAGKIPSADREKMPEIPWQEIVGLRNRLAHEYAIIDLSIVWTVCTHDIPKLLVSLEEIIDRNS